jgi:MFS superfamily sulfate permease-like transporter
VNVSVFAGACPGRSPYVPDRAIIAILPAVSIGFICGVIVSALQLEDSPTLWVGVAGGIAVAMAGASSVFGVRGDKSEKGIVGLLRGACAVALYACMFLFILKFLRQGDILGALPWVVLGIAFGLVLTQLRVRERGDAPARTAE